jgi:hypothetical protein
MVRSALHFVVSQWKKWGPWLSASRQASDHVTRVRSNEDSWIVLTYMQLTSRGLAATIGGEPVVGSINVVDGISFDAETSSPECYYLGCRGDGPYPTICQTVIHQNLVHSPELPSLYLPQWPQPGIIARSTERRGVCTIGFLGHAAVNLAASFKEPVFRNRLRARGYELMVRGRVNDALAWHDYSHIDLVLAVRDIPRTHLVIKPVNKLTNSWIAGVPAMLGREPAVEAIAQSPLDYFPVTEPADVFRALHALERDPALYERMVKHGSARAGEYREEAVASRWQAALEHVDRQFQLWEQLGRASKCRDHQRRLLLHRASMERHAREVLDEYRRMGYGEAWWHASDALSEVLR